MKGLRLRKCAFVRAVFSILAFSGAAGVFATPLKVVATLQDLAAVAQAVGGNHVTVKALVRSGEDPHFLSAKPSLMKAVQDADLYVAVGLELEVGWLPLVLQGSRNPRIQPGSSGFLDASEKIPVLEKPTGAVDRSQGDVHPLGNPHYYTDPVMMKKAAESLAGRLSDLDPEHRAGYLANAESFSKRLDKAVERWQARLKPFAGRAVVPVHSNLAYFLDRFRLKAFGYVEPRAGIPPSPRYLEELAASMRRSGVRAVLYQPFHDPRTAKKLAAKAGGVAVVVETESPTMDVFAHYEAMVAAVEGSLR